MGAQGTGTLDFGAFPGSNDTSLVITGQSSINTSSLVEAWVLPKATADHSIAEHYVDPPVVMAGEIVGSTGFTIRGFSQPVGVPKCYGTWNVAWVWN